MSEPTRDVARWAPGLLLVLCPLFGMRTGDAQTGPTPEFSVNLEAGLIRLGATTNLVITVRNHDQATIEPLLAIQGVRFGRLRGPEVRTYSTFDSRTLTRNFDQTMTWTMEVRPHELGEYVIGPVVASLGGERVERRVCVGARARTCAAPQHQLRFAVASHLEQQRHGLGLHDER